MKNAFLDANAVNREVVNALNARDGAGWTLAGETDIWHLPWSTLYFMAVRRNNDSAPLRLVVKIVHFPDQTQPEISWQSDELLRRGQREFASMEIARTHFEGQVGLHTIEPEIYIPAINALVMRYAASTPLYTSAIKPRALLRPGGMARAVQLMFQVGQWLRHLHRLPTSDVPSERLKTPADSLQAAESASKQLETYGTRVDIRLLRQAVTTAKVPPVWCHCDFHMRNVHVEGNDEILAFDTALERADTPYFDIGKFLADLKTRRSRILAFGLIPPGWQVNRLYESFLAGYFQGETIDRSLLTLYQGQFILEKWVESLETIQAKLPRPLRRLLVGLIINPTFRRIFKRAVR